MRQKGAIATYKGHMKGVSCVELSPDSRYTASGDHAGGVRIWDMTSGKCIKQFDLNKLSDFDNLHVTSLSFNPRDFCLAVAASDKIIRYFDLESG